MTPKVKRYAMEFIAKLLTDRIPISPVETGRMAKDNWRAATAIVMGGYQDAIT